MKILIVTYTYPPSKSVNGNRPFYFAQALQDHGHEVHVLTRHFTGVERSDQYNDDNLTPYSLSNESGIMVHRVPFSNTWFKYMNYRLFNNTSLWKIFYLAQLICGRTTQESYNKYFKSYTFQIIKTFKPQKVIVESGPTNLVRLVSKVCTRFSIPYIIDFRDVYYHEMLFKGQLPFSKNIKIFFEKYYMRSVIRRADSVVGESVQKLRVLTVPEKKSYIIHNGYDEKLWSTANIVNTADKKFVILIAGRIYDHPFLSVLLKALSDFQALRLPNVLIRFLAPGDKRIIELIKKELNFEPLDIISDRVSQIMAIQYIMNSQVLAYHGWRGYTGIYSTKIYDYIRSGKRILLCPSDHDVVHNILKQVEGSYQVDDSAKAVDVLVSIYTSWKSDNLNDIKRNQDIYQYSRQFQSNKIVTVIEHAN